MRFRTLLALCLWPALTLEAQQGRDWSTRDRVVIGDFTRITSVAAAQDRVFATSPDALLIWNPQFRQWEGSVTPPDAGLLGRVFAALIDPLDNSLWLARIDGWVHFQPAIRLWDQGLVPGGVQEIAFDLDNPVAGLYLRSGGSWYVVPRGGGTVMPAGGPPAHPLRPLSIQDAIHANPTLQANSAQILMDNRLASARFTAAARSFDGLGWYLGTWGIGLLYLPDGAALPERLTFGLPGAVATALYPAPGGVWVATDRTTTSPAGLAFVASDLSGFTWELGRPGFGMPFQYVRHLIGLDQDLWAATDHGVARIRPGRDDIELFDQGRGLPDNRTYWVTARRGNLAAGTAHGIVRIQDGEIQRIAPGYTDAAYALAYSREADTLWVGTPRGLRAAVEGQSDLVVPMELETSAALGEPVIAVQWSGDTLMAATQDRIMWRDNRLHSWWLGPTISPRVGRIRSFATAPGGVWVGGEDAVGFVPFNAQPVRLLRYPGDLPGRPIEVAVDDDYLWISTDQGLVRFRLDAVRP